MAVFYREHYLHADEMRAPEAYVDSVCSAGNGTSDDLRGKKPQGEKKRTSDRTARLHLVVDTPKQQTLSLDCGFWANDNLCPKQTE